MELINHQIKKQMNTIIDALNKATIEYDKGVPIITDEEWDNLYFKLVQLETNFKFALPNSPTQQIYFEEVSKLEKVEHNHPMLSLKKTKELNEIKSFINTKDFIAMLKLDGLTCSLTYEKGRLIAAETRGNGIIGENILHNARVIQNIPKTISSQIDIVVDGEIICPEDIFEKNFSKEYKNSRNYSAGAIRRLDSKENENCGLSFVAWDCISKEFNHAEIFLSDKLMGLEGLGFEVVPFISHNKNEYIEPAINSLKQSALAYSYPIDGIVFKYDNCEYYNSLGATDHHFRGGLAYKFYDEIYETRLKRIEWTMGRTGILTPVAVFESIDIDGTEVSRASLHNISVLKETLGSPYLDQKIWVAKMNQIIPQIVEAEKWDIL